MKRILLLLTTYSLFLTSVFAQDNWINLPNAPASWRFDDIYFLTPRMGWAIHAYYSYLTPNQYGQIYKTSDGGNTWQLMHDSSLTFYRSVGFVDSLHGWIGNLADTTLIKFTQVTPDSNPLYYTSDGGKTLTPVVFPSPKPAGICGISVASDSVVYAYGRYYSNPVLAKTTNAGKTWTTQDMSAYASVGLIDGWFWSKDTGFITGQDGQNAVILHTHDGGATWQTLYHATRNDSDHVWKIFFPSRNVGYGSLECLKPSQNNRYFVKTIDGGKTWTEYPFVSDYDEEGCGFINDSVGWIGGDVLFPTYITTDGGITWNQDNNFGIDTPPYDTYGPNEYSINRFRKFGDTLMYASGNTVYKLSTGPAGIKQIHPPHAALSNYPNPFREQTTIAYTLPAATKNVRIEVYTGIGVKTFSKDLGSQAAGKHNYKLSASFPAGAYLYRIVSDNYCETGTLTRVK